MEPVPERNRAVSFIVPALNAEATLVNCLDAILATHDRASRHGLFVIDNGSTDLTLDIARSRGATIVSAPGKTVAGLRNLGARLAQGDLLAYVDADCVIAPDWLERALPHFDDGTVAAVGSPTKPPQAATWVQSAWALHRHRHDRLAAVQWLPTENLLVRATALHEVGGFNETLVTCEDVDFCYRLGPRYKIISDPAIHSIHLGEAPTLKAFFKKEVWRGSGNIPGFLSHSLRLSELPSIFMPFYHLSGIIAFIASLGYWLGAGPGWPALAATLFLLLPSLLLALRTVTRTRTYRLGAQLALLYWVFSSARSLSLFIGSRPLRKPPHSV